MASRHVVRSLPGHVGFLLAILVSTFTSLTAVSSYFYEGWGQPILTAATYLVPALLVVGACALAVRRPRAGGMLLLVYGAGAATWWLSRQVQAGRLSAIVVETAVVFFGPIVLAGGLFLLEARHRRLLATEGVPASRRRWARSARPALVVGLPLLAIALGPGRQLPELLDRLDDGQRGARTIAGRGIVLVWAPQGPGWNLRQADGEYPPWNAIATYGVAPAGFKSSTAQRGAAIGTETMARTGLCGYLGEDGSSLLPEPIHVWRLPTADEVVRSLTRGGRNAGCVWDGKSPHAVCERPPDKETPLWAPDQSPIYYLTSDVIDADHALGVNYTGGISPHRKASAGVGYRCVKPASPDSGPR